MNKNFKNKKDEFLAIFQDKLYVYILISLISIGYVAGSLLYLKSYFCLGLLLFAIVMLFIALNEHFKIMNNLELLRYEIKSFLDKKTKK